MSTIMESLIDFSIIFVLGFIIDYFLINRRKNDFTKLKKNDTIRLFLLRYNIDYRKIDRKKLLVIISLANVFIIALTSVVILRIDKLIWKILVCFVMILILLYAIYELIARYFIKHQKDEVSDAIEVIKKKRKKTKKEDDK